MTEDSAIIEAIDRLYGAVTTPQDWPSAWEGVAGLVRADHAVVLARGSAAGYPLVASVGLDLRHASRFSTPEAVRFGDAFLSGLPLGMVVSRTDVVSDREWENAPAYNEIIRPVDGFQSMHARVGGPGETTSFVNLCRARRAGDFDLVERAKLQTIVPHLANALELLRRLGIAEHQNHGLSRLLDEIDSGVILLDAAGRPCFANGEAMRIMAEKDGLAVGPSGLFAATPVATQRLRQALARMTAPDGTDARLLVTAGRRMRLRLDRPSLRPPLLLTLVPIYGLGAGSPQNAGPLIAVFIADPDGRPSIDRDALADAFHLTARELAVAELLAGGYDLKRAAQALSISVGTARNHLKHAFKKTNTHNQVSLVAVLRGFGPHGR